MTTPTPHLVLDIETAAIDDAATYLEPSSPPKNYVDATKIADYVEKADREKLDKASLDPDLGKIIAIGYMLEGRDIEPRVLLCRTEQEERVGLVSLWREAVLSYGGHRPLVTFNGFKFDLPFLLRRSLYLGVIAPPLNLDKYRSPHIDLWQKLSFNGAIPAHSLAFYGHRFGLCDPDPVHGEDIPRLVREGSDASWRAIAMHCMLDVLTTYRLASRMGYLQLTEQENAQQPGEDAAVGFF